CRRRAGGCRHLARSHPCSRRRARRGMSRAASPICLAPQPAARHLPRDRGHAASPSNRRHRDGHRKRRCGLVRGVHAAAACASARVEGGSCAPPAALGARGPGGELTMLPALRDDGSVNVVVESPRGSAVKFKYDPEIERFVLSRPLPAGLVYPHDWGFVPSTRASDGDPLDALIAWDGASYPGIVIPCRLIGVLEVEQTNAKSHARERNDRIIALPLKAPRQDDIHSVFDFSDRWRSELERFFVNAVAFERKE